MVEPVAPVVESAPAALRARVDALLAVGNQRKALETLQMWSRQYALTPWVMESLGTLYLAAGKRVDAGRAFFWAGVRDLPGSAESVGEFLASVRRRPDRLVATLPPKARRSLELLPEPLRRELQQLGVTDAVVAKANRPDSQWSKRTLTGILLGILALAVVGAWTCWRALREWWGATTG